MHERSKETPKTVKQITRLFPNKVSIQLPQVIFYFSLSFTILFLLLYMHFDYLEEINQSAREEGEVAEIHISLYMS